MQKKADSREQEKTVRQNGKLTGLDLKKVKTALLANTREKYLWQCHSFFSLFYFPQNTRGGGGEGVIWWIKNGLS